MQSANTTANFTDERIVSSREQFAAVYAPPERAGKFIAAKRSDGASAGTTR